jgi:hypothetical protein
VGNELNQGAEWRALHDRITEVLDRFGKKDAFGDGDYWLLDDDWGRFTQEVEVQNLALLQAHIVRLLHALLADYPDWQVIIRVDRPEKKGIWPGMGLIVRDDEIVDELCREFLPPETRHITYEGIAPVVHRRSRPER